MKPHFYHTEPFGNQNHLGLMSSVTAQEPVRELARAGPPGRGGVQHHRVVALFCVPLSPCLRHSGCPHVAGGLWEMGGFPRKLIIQ